MKALLALPLALLAFACSSVRVGGDPDFRLERGSTFAWAADPAEALDDEVPFVDYLRTVIARLDERGVTRTTTGSADYLVDIDVAIRLRVRENDPYFELFVAEEFEEAEVRLEFRDARSNRLLWAGEVRHRLRFTRRSMGGLPPKWEPVDEPRQWFAEREVDRLFDAFD